MIIIPSCTANPIDDFFEYIRHIRIQKELSLADLCKSANISTKSFNKYQSGQMKPTTSVIMSICKSLGFTIEDFFKLRVSGIEYYSNI